MNKMNVYSNLVDDDPHSIRMFYPAFRLNNFIMHAIVPKTSAEYSVEFHLPSRDLYTFRSDGFAINPSMRIFDIRDIDESSAIFDAFDDYNLDRVYELAKKITEKVVNQWEAEIENAE